MRLVSVYTSPIGFEHASSAHCTLEHRVELKRFDGIVLLLLQNEKLRMEIKTKQKSVEWLMDWILLENWSERIESMNNNNHYLFFDFTYSIFFSMATWVQSTPNRNKSLRRMLVEFTNVDQSLHSDHLLFLGFRCHHCLTCSMFFPLISAIAQVHTYFTEPMHMLRLEIWYRCRHWHLQSHWPYRKRLRMNAWIKRKVFWLSHVLSSFKFISAVSTIRFVWFARFPFVISGGRWPGRIYAFERFIGIDEVKSTWKPQLCSANCKIMQKWN